MSLVPLQSSLDYGAKGLKPVLFGVLLAFVFLAVSVGASAAPDVREGTVFADVVRASNDSFVLKGETIMVEFELTELLTGAPDVNLDFWSSGSKTASRKMIRPDSPLEGVVRTNITPLWFYYYAITPGDPNADYLEVDVGNVCNASGGCNDPLPRRINVSVLSSGDVTVSNDSNFVDAFRKAARGGTIDFSAGVYNNLQVDVDKPLNLVSDTGDYRTSGVVFTGNSSIDVNSDDVSVKGFRFENVAPIARGPGSFFTKKAAVIRVENGSLSNLRFEKNKFSNITEPSRWQPSYGIQLVRDNSALVYNRNVLIADNEYAHSDGSFIFAKYVNDSVFEDNVVDNVSGIGLYLEGGSNVRVLNNTINNTASSAIEFSDASATYVKGNVIENADLPPNEDNYYARGAIVFSDGSEGIIEGNTITDSNDAIILCSLCDEDFLEDDLDDPAPVNFTVTNNVIHSNLGLYDVFSHSRNPVLQAVYNYWGSSDGPNLSRLSGEIVYNPYSSDELKSSFTISSNASLSAGDSFTFNMSYNEELNRVLKNVTLNLNDTSADDVRLVVSVIGSARPANLSGGSLPSRTAVYNYLEINISENVTDNATIIFSVPTSWLRSNRVNKNDVVLMRLSGGSWERLETAVVRETRDEVTFSAVTPGFSFFVVAGTVTSRSSSGSGSRSSGGGSSYIPAANTFPWLFVDRQAVNVVQRLNPAEPFVFDTSGRGVVVTSVTVDVNTAVNNGVLIAASLRSRPSSISDDPEGTVYRYVGVGMDNVNAAYVDSITTTFAVSKEWMESNNAGSENVVLFAYDKTSSSWVNVGARMVNETSAEVLFEAETKGSEIFAIVSHGEGAVETEPETAEPEIIEPPAEPVDGGQGEVPAEPEVATPEPEAVVTDTGRGGGLSPLAITVMIILAVGVLVLVFARYYKRKA